MGMSVSSMLCVMYRVIRLTTILSNKYSLSAFHTYTRFPDLDRPRLFFSPTVLPVR